jgi:hypothetical protein
LQAVKGWSQLVAGIDQRVPIGIVDPNGVPVPGATVRVQVITVPAPGATASPVAVGPAEAAPYRGDLLEGKGTYVIHRTFAQAGFYRALVEAEKGGVTTRTQFAFEVSASDPTPAVGAPAPRTRNATGDPNVDKTLDTGVPPDDMHYISVADAIGKHHAVVVYFGTPGFCTSKLCAPEVKVLQQVESKYRARSVDFVHIETYKGGRPDNVDLTKATVNPWFDEWKLQTDPWVFIVGRDGNIAAKFDGAVTADELTPALDKASA